MTLRVGLSLVQLGWEGWCDLSMDSWKYCRGCEIEPQLSQMRNIYYKYH